MNDITAIVPTLELGSIVQFGDRLFEVSGVGGHGTDHPRVALTLVSSVCESCNGQGLIESPYWETLQTCPTCDGNGSSNHA